MLHFIQSNQLERLFDRLCQVLSKSTESPLQAQEIVVQNPGMAKWVSQQIAFRNGIAANFHFPLPARFIWQIFASQLELEDDEGDFDRSILLWKILKELKSSGLHSNLAEVGRYLDSDHDGRKAFYLAGKIADLYDQYLVYRPDLLLQWQSTPDSDWQSVLWQKMTVSSRLHRAEYLKQFRAKVLQGKLDAAALPQRMYFFGVGSLAPVYLEIVHAVSTVAEVYLFHLNPCRDYWADVASDAEIARKRAAAARKNIPGVFDYHESGNPLLASLGTVGREFVDRIYNLEMIEEEHYVSPKGHAMLACVQRDILDLKDHSGQDVEKNRVLEEDHSVQFHSCHSRVREVQVLHDRLLEIFERSRGLKPGDILVMAPAIEQYAAAVSSVFNGAEGSKFIPWSLADRSVKSDGALIDSFLALFELCTGRCSASEVVSFLETRAVMRRFEIDDKGLATIRKWIMDCGIRWGLDRSHREHFNADMEDTHSWSFGMDRLLMGYFVGEEQERVHGVSPCAGTAGANGELLGRLAAFLDCICRTREQFIKQHSPDEWSVLLLKILDELYEPGTDEEDQQVLLTMRDAICRLGDTSRQAGFTGKLSLPVMKAWLVETLDQASPGQAFLSGSVTFCNMVPMRSVPFEVICVLGMNDTDYPRNQTAVSFDLMARSPQPGDRNRRDDDRYLFLEALISVRKVFYISWLGQSLKDNSSRPPSVVVAELYDYLCRSFVDSSGKSHVVPITEHPLQPFSRRSYDGTAGISSYADQWIPRPAGNTPNGFVSQPLPNPSDEWRSLDIARLMRFWSHPVRFFLQHRLEIEVRDEVELLEDVEPFQPGFLERYMLADQFLEARINNIDKDDHYAQLVSEGVLPHQNFGRNLYEDLNESTEALLPEIVPLLKEPKNPLEVDLDIAPYRLKGWLPGLYEAGCIRYRPARLKGRDMVKLWVEHLVYNAIDHPGYVCRSIHVANDTMVVFQPVENPLFELQKILDLYWQGLSSPLHFYPETSRAWYEAKEERKVSEALKAWQGGYAGRGEGEGLEYQIALQADEPLDQDFEQLAEAVFGSINEHMEGENGDV